MADYMRQVHADTAVSRVLRWQPPAWDVYLQVNSGPPTWRTPKAVCRTPADAPVHGSGLEVMVGWLRLCVAMTFIRRSEEA
jgi:hypothetical protein